MIVQGEQPWKGIGRYGGWKEIEPLWDGTRQWRYVEAPQVSFLTLLARLPSTIAMQTKVRWLEDEAFPTSVVAATA